MAIISGTENICGRGVFIFRGRDILVDAAGEAAGADSLAVIPQQQVKDVIVDTVTGMAAALLSSDAEAVPGTCFQPLRSYFFSHDEQQTGLASRLKALVTWHSVTRFCPVCGARLEEHPTENAMSCPSCGALHFPRIEPCIIVLVLKGEEVLLLRHRNRNQDIFACLAGFVEAGETAEQALHREIREEAGVEVDNVRYVGSQSWPFPDQLMLAYYADYVSGELKIQESEISEARWFHKDDIPAAPAPGSIAWRLIHFDF